MFLSFAISLLLSVRATTALPWKQITQRSADFSFGSDVIRGVNIGGWLVLEPWITPSIFQSRPGVVDEYTLGEQLGQVAALAVLQNHWSTWASLADFQKIADAGFNLVRIPIGYWAYEKFDDDCYVQGAAPFMDAAIGWANQTGLKVWIDLHGAPGSQNGFDNSGQRMNEPQWQQGDTVNQTLGVLKQISDKYAQPEYDNLVVAIELLNEPLSSELDMEVVTQFYKDGFGDVRVNSNTTTVIMHDAFEPATYWDNTLTPTNGNAYNVVVDHHEYQVFNDDQIAWSNAKHRQGVCNGVGSYSNADHWVVVGEWTAAETDCAPALNGQGIGARYDGTYPGSTFIGNCSHFNDISQWNQTLKDDTRGYIEAQMEVFEQQTRGWVFWNFKTEAAAEWDLFQLLDAGIFPQPLSDRQYPSVCS
ncbi:MAG: exo-1,3-beta-glucanase [Pycnora praestabilis]|nr:MAG: exo-1,3-beta-glucanase [Pycnora praestabilis]